jgi:hypothetical protein
MQRIITKEKGDAYGLRLFCAFVLIFPAGPPGKKRRRVRFYRADSLRLMISSWACLLRLLKSTL